MSKSFLEDLNEKQRQAVTYDQGPSLILAGAGSGKTRTLTYKAAYLIKEKGLDPEEILLLTFTNKAAEEMKERLRQLNIEPPKFMGTFHSLGAKILRRDGHYLGFSQDFVIYDEDDQKDLIKKVLGFLGFSEKEFNPLAVMSLIEGAKNELISALEYPQYARGFFQKTVAQIYLNYQKYLKKYQALDFADLLLETVRLFKKEKEVLQKYQNQFSYILVDEYQDTNHTQYQLTKLLAKQHHRLCAVGDCSQSIYMFRGADFRNILNLKNDFPEIIIFNLEENYRSKQNILDAAHAVIKKNTSHPILKLWTKKDRGEKIKIYEASSEKDEAEFLVRNIKPEDYRDTAVLYRTNAQSRAIEEVFIKNGIPYNLVGGTRFYQRKEIKDCLSFLRLLANPRDMVAYDRILKIGKRRLDKFLIFMDKEKKAKEWPTLELLNKILVVTDYLKLFDEKKKEDLSRIENIKELGSVAAKFPKLTEFLENVSLVEREYQGQRLQKGVKKDAVTLMTLHGAKGLEFKTVFLVGMEEGLFPHSRSLFSRPELEEERRLCYVGITRAKERLFLTYASRRLYFGGRVSNDISRFITDLPEELIDFV